MSSSFLTNSQNLKASSPKAALWTFIKTFLKKKISFKRNQRSKLFFIFIYNGLNFPKSLMLAWPSWPFLRCGVSLMAIPGSVTSALPNAATTSMLASFWVIILALCVRIASHYHLCAVACVCSIFINSYFYSEPCWLQSILSESWLQPKHQWEEQWEDWQLWKGRVSLPIIQHLVTQQSLTLTQSFLVLLLLDP